MTNEREKLYEKIQEILEKHKDNPELHSKLDKLSKKFLRLPYLDFTHYKELAKLTSKVDYKCYFDDGSCKKYRHGSEMCCCSGCRNSSGFFGVKFFRDHDSVIIIEEELLYYAEKFDSKTGFWRKNKGCVLPRERRSATCLTHNCYGKFSKEVKLLFAILYDSKHKGFPIYIDLIIETLKNYFLYREN